jgi:hypothetical protein
VLTPARCPAPGLRRPPASSNPAVRRCARRPLRAGAGFTRSSSTATGPIHALLRPGTAHGAHLHRPAERPWHHGHRCLVAASAHGIPGCGPGELAPGRERDPAGRLFYGEAAPPIARVRWPCLRPSRACRVHGLCPGRRKRRGLRGDPWTLRAGRGRPGRLHLLTEWHSAGARKRRQYRSEPGARRTLIEPSAVCVIRAPRRRGRRRRRRGGRGAAAALWSNRARSGAPSPS